MLMQLPVYEISLVVIRYKCSMSDTGVMVSPPQSATLGLHTRKLLCSL